MLPRWLRRAMISALVQGLVQVLVPETYDSIPRRRRPFRAVPSIGSFVRQPVRLLHYKWREGLDLFPWRYKRVIGKR